jgi:hypothetical protein
LNALWGISSAGRAPGLQPGGHRFEPGILHQPSLIARCARSFGWQATSQAKVVSERVFESRREGARGERAVRVSPRERSGAKGPRE